MVFSEFAKSEDWNRRARWVTETIISVIGVPLENDRRGVDSGQSGSSSGPCPKSLRCHFEGARIQRERITKPDIEEFGATIGRPGCSAIKDNKRAQATHIVAESESKSASEPLHMEQKDWIEEMK